MEFKHQSNGVTSGYSYEEIFGNGKPKYKVKTVAEYEKEIRAMTFSDIQAECLRVKLGPSINRDLMIINLKKTFSRSFERF